MKSLKKAILTGVLTGVTMCTMTICSNATTVKVTTETLNVRKGPSTDTEVIAMLSEGVECELLNEEGNWYKVKYKNYTGYVSKDYVKVIGTTNNNQTNENNEQSTSQQNNTNNNSEQNNKEENNPNSNTASNNSEQNNTQNNQNSQGSTENNNSQVNNEPITYKKFSRNTDVKLLPLIHSSKIGSVKTGTQVVFITEASGWSYIQTDLISGWVRSDTLSEEVVTSTNSNEDNSEKKGYVNESSVNLRKASGTSSSIIKVLTLNTEVTILAEENGWYKVKAGNNTGYILKEYVSSSKKVTSRSNENSRTENSEADEGNSNQESTNNKVSTSSENASSTNKVTTQAISSSSKTSTETKTNSSTSTTNTKSITNSSTSTTNTKSTNSSSGKTSNQSNNTSSKNTTTSQTNKVKGTDIVAYAQKYLGYKYVYGGDGSNNTFDCSGFTMYVFKHFGIKLSHGANAQYNSGKGKKISKQSDLQVGDIVFLTDYETGKGIGHCGIYLGNGNFIHASTTTYTVTISSLNTMYKGRFYAGLRLV